MKEIKILESYLHVLGITVHLKGKACKLFSKNIFPQIVETFESFILFNAKSGRKDEVKRKKKFRVIFVLQESEMKCSGDIRCNNGGCCE